MCEIVLDKEEDTKINFVLRNSFGRYTNIKSQGPRMLQWGLSAPLYLPSIRQTWFSPSQMLCWEFGGKAKWREGFGVEGEERKEEGTIHFHPAWMSKTPQPKELWKASRKMVLEGF